MAITTQEMCAFGHTYLLRQVFNKNILSYSCRCSKGKAMKGANTVFACDGQSNAVLYTRADILRNEESQEIKKFVNYWKGISGNLDETLVFDCRFTNYAYLEDLSIYQVKSFMMEKSFR